MESITVSPRSFLVVPVLLVLTASATLAQGETADILTFTFDHLLQKGGATMVRELVDGEQFKVALAHTCPDQFDYSLYRSPTETGVRSLGTGRHPLTTVTKGPIAHEARWGSYILEVTLKKDGVPCASEQDATQTADLQPAKYIVAVQTPEWEVGVDLGPAFANGTDKRYTIAPSPTDATKKVVVEDTAGESSARLAVATLTHFYIPGLPVATGPVAGFSILTAGSDNQANNQTQYYLGWGAGIGPRKFRLNAAVGAAYSAVPTLPAGINVGDQITDVSTISTLRNVYRWRFFFAFSGNAFKTGEESKPAAPNGPSKK